MTKRADGKFKKVKNNFYPTPEMAVIPLLNQLDENTVFVEPCAGDGRLIKHLTKYGHQCLFASDIEPKSEGINELDIINIPDHIIQNHTIITNPPWDLS